MRYIPVYKSLNLSHAGHHIQNTLRPYDKIEKDMQVYQKTEIDERRHITHRH